MENQRFLSGPPTGEPLRAPKSEARLIETLTSCRWTLSYVGLLGFLLIYVTRANISMAMVCMVRPQPPSNSSRVGNISQPACAVAHHNDSSYSERAPTPVGDIGWDKELQGYILGALFYGYMVSQVPGGWLAGRFGGKLVFGVCMAVNVAANLLLPAAARYDGSDYRTSGYLVIALRVIMGVFTGPLFPAMNNLWGKWAPPLERSKLLALCYAGTTVGNIIVLGFGGFMCQWTSFDGGWPSLFYVPGIAGVAFCVLWFLCVHNSPLLHPRITPLEREYITGSLEERSSAAETNKSVPWKSIITSPAVWAITAGHVCNNFGNYTIITTMPAYMKEVLQFDITENGLYSALPQVGLLIGTLIVGEVADVLRRKEMSTAAVRKWAMGIGLIVPAAFMMGVSLVSCEERVTGIVFMVLALTFNSFTKVGYMVNHVDIAPRFAGELFGFTNTFATIPGMVSPTLVNSLTVNGTQEEWQKVFYIWAAIFAFGSVVFILFGKGKVQSWAYASTAAKQSPDVSGDKQELHTAGQGTSSLPGSPEAVRAQGADDVSEETPTVADRTSHV